MNPSLFLRAFALCTACLAADPAAAVPITYSISGLGSGHLGSQAFSDAAFVFTGMGDTDTLVPIGGGVWVNPLLSLEVKVRGHGAAQGLGAVDFFVNKTSSGLGFLDELVGDLIDVLGTGLTGFDGVSALGPVAVDLDYLAPFSTTAGEFLLDRGSSLTFSARLGPATVPAPASSWLAVSALLALAWVRQRERQPAALAPCAGRGRQVL